MKYTPIPDKYCPSEDIANLGGSFLTQTNANILRKYETSTTGYVGSISSFTKNFDNIITFSIYSLNDSSSSNYIHAITYLTNFNPFVKYYQELVTTAFPYVVVMNIQKKDYGDRIKLDSLKINLNNHEYLTNRINYSFSNFYYDKTVDLNYDGITDFNDFIIADASTTSINQIQIISATSQNDYRIFNKSISSLENYYYFYPFFNESNEVLFYSSGALTSSRNFIGKLFPYNGYALITDDFYDLNVAKIFVNSITSVEYYTELDITELNTYIIKDSFEMNGSRNPSIFKNVLSASSTSIIEQGYSYGRDGLTGASGVFIDTISAFNTYATSIALYNDLNELLMITKLPQPIRLIPDLPYSFKIPLDVVIK